MDQQSEARLLAALREFMQVEGMLQGLPASAPQSVQSGGRPAPAPNAIGVRHPDERAPVPIQQTAQEFGDAALGFGASAADPLGIPSALLGTVAPGARDAWRTAQGAGGLGPQLAGGLLSGFGAGNAMLRGGSALGRMAAPYLGMSEAGGATLGMIGGGAATGAAPVIDMNPNGPSGASWTNAMLGPLTGAAIPLGIAAAGPVMNAFRANPVATAAGATTALAGGTALAQQGQSPGTELDEFTRTLHSRNPALAAAYQLMLQRRQAAATANSTSAELNKGSLRNTGAKEAAGRADSLADAAAQEYIKLLREATTAAEAADPTFRQQFGPNLANRLVRSMAIPFGLGLAGGIGSASLGRLVNRMARREVAAGNTAAEAGNTQGALTHSNNANAMLKQAPSGSWMTPGVGLSALVGGEMAIAPKQWDQEATPGSPARKAADDYMSSWRWPLDFGMGALMGATAYKGGRYAVGRLNEAIPGKSRLAPTGEAESLATRVKTMQQAPPPAIPAAPPPQPPAPPAGGPPPGNQPPIDYQTMLNQIGARPLPPVAANSNVARPTNAGANLYQGELQANIRDQIARQLLRDGQINLDMMRSAMERSGIMPGVIERARAAAEAANAAITNGATPQAVAAALRRGGIRNMSVIGAGGAAAAATHHSASQPRGADGRFETAE